MFMAGWESSVSVDEMPSSYFGKEEAKMPSSGLPICDLTDCCVRTERNLVLEGWSRDHKTRTRFHWLLQCYIIQLQVHG